MNTATVNPPVQVVHVIPVKTVILIVAAIIGLVLVFALAKNFLSVSPNPPCTEMKVATGVATLD